MRFLGSGEPHRMFYVSRDNAFARLLFDYCVVPWMIRSVVNNKVAVAGRVLVNHGTDVDIGLLVPRSTRWRAAGAELPPSRVRPCGDRGWSYGLSPSRAAPHRCFTGHRGWGRCEVQQMLGISPQR